MPHVISGSHRNISYPALFYLLGHSNSLSEDHIFRIESLADGSGAGTVVDVTAYTPNYLNSPSAIDLIIQSGLYDLAYSVDEATFTSTYTEGFDISHSGFDPLLPTGFSRDRTNASRVWYASFDNVSSPLHYGYMYRTTDGGVNWTRIQVFVYDTTTDVAEGLVFATSRHNDTDAFLYQTFTDTALENPVTRIYLVGASVTSNVIIPDDAELLINAFSGAVRNTDSDTFYFMARADLQDPSFEYRGYLYSYVWSTATLTLLDQWVFARSSQTYYVSLFSTATGTLIWGTPAPVGSDVVLHRWADGDLSWTDVSFPVPSSYISGSKIAQDSNGVLFMPYAVSPLGTGGIFSVDDGLTWHDAGFFMQNYSILDIDGV